MKIFVSIFPQLLFSLLSSFPNIIYHRVFTLSLSLAVFVKLAYYSLLTSLPNIPPIEICRFLILAMRINESFPGECRNVSGENRKGKFSGRNQRVATFRRDQVK